MIRTVWLFFCHVGIFFYIYDLQFPRVQQPFDVCAISSCPSALERLLKICLGVLTILEVLSGHTNNCNLGRIEAVLTPAQDSTQKTTPPINFSSPHAVAV